MPRYRASRKRRPTADDLTYERDMQETIRQAANLTGWKYYHTYDARRSPEGFPDVVLAGYGSLVFWEIKSTDGHPTASQRVWLSELGKVDKPPRVDVVRPKDLDWCLTLLGAKGKM